MENISKTRVKPILKWAGGKSALVHDIKHYLEGIKFKRYIEPFFGSGAVYFSLVKNNSKIINNSKISDTNKDLIQLYKNLKKNPSKLIKEHQNIKEEFSSRGYYYIRDKYNGENGLSKYSGIKRSAALMVINKTCFNGLYRVNKNDMFNVPEGKYTRPAFVDEHLMFTISKLLPKLENILHSSFMDIKYRKGDLIYFDPPYDPLNKTSSFTDYNSSRFGKEEQEKLCYLFNKLNDSGKFVILSNSATPFIRELYSDHEIHELSVSRSINSKINKRGKIKELIIIGSNFKKNHL